MSEASELSAAYGRDVPSRVRLNDEFDAPEWSASGPGDVVKVALPFVDVETDASSLFVELTHRDGEQTLVERVYDHEYEKVEE